MNNHAHLKKGTPFYDLFQNGMCPIINLLVPSQAQLEGSTETEVYMVDLSKVSDATLSEIARRLATKAGVPPMVVFGEIKGRGLPLRASQCSGTSSDSLSFL